MKVYPVCGKVQVLLLEDNCVLASALIDILTELDFAVIGPLSSNDQAIATLNDGKFAIDIGLLDIHLGRESSFATADEFERRSIPYIFCSGQHRADMDHRYRHRPCLLKPFGARALEAAMRAALSNNKTERFG